MTRSHGKTKYPRLRLRWLPLLYILSVSALFLLFRHKVQRAITSSSTQFSINNDRSLLKPLPRLAYLISGTKGDVKRVKRLLSAVHHPRSWYLLLLDQNASDSERLELAKFAKVDFRNVMVVGEADFITDKGPTALASTLHAVAILLEMAPNWDWFINLSASDYPLMSQDDILHIFSYLPRDLNFIEHTSDLGWREYQRARPLVIDPGLSDANKSSLSWAKEKRTLPFAFKLFAGSEWVVLSKQFLEFCIWGWDNLPRILLMYYTNYLSSSEGYFHTVICNHRDYQNTTVNHDLRYQKWGSSPEQRLVPLTLMNFEEMVESGALFGRPFREDDEVLDRIDRVLLGRPDDRLWCSEEKGECSVDSVTPSVNSKRFEKLLLGLLDADSFRFNQCK